MHAYDFGQLLQLVAFSLYQHMNMLMHTQTLTNTHTHTSTSIPLELLFTWNTCIGDFEQCNSTNECFFSSLYGSNAMQSNRNKIGKFPCFSHILFIYTRMLSTLCSIPIVCGRCIEREKRSELSIQPIRFIILHILKFQYRIHWFKRIYGNESMMMMMFIG